MKPSVFIEDTPARTFKEIVYECSKPTCRHRQTMRYFANQPVLPALCCVKCRAGFGAEMDVMVANRFGMLPGKVEMVEG